MGQSAYCCVCEEICRYIYFGIGRCQRAEGVTLRARFPPRITFIPSHTGTMRPYLLLLAFLPAILALQANLAGLVDWHKPLLGQPLLEPSPPSIVETSAGRRILAITQKNLLGALDDKGEVVWRQQTDEGEPVVSYHVEGESEYCTSYGRRALIISCSTTFWSLCYLCSTTFRYDRSLDMGEATTPRSRDTINNPRPPRYRCLHSRHIHHCPK
jgi:hypothetical protein